MEIIIDIENLSRQYDVTKQAVSAALFPGNNYPAAAYARMVRLGGGNMKAVQMLNLATLLGCRPGDLFKANPKTFRHTTDSTGLHTFARASDNARVTLDAATGTTLIYLSDVHVMKTVISDKAIPMDEYLSQLDVIISEFRQSAVAA
jgi:hypothetical protein